ncbi:ATP-binding protein [Tautonia sp. JC769]|uniref:ATP-binding protein n=1 Tax=Tautonia sp. JC769 TaxID=3232135 RepID=UPI0034583B99
MKESQNTEWKESWRDEYLKWLCGFANAEGGVLVIGRDDKGAAVGVRDAKKLLEDLPNKIRDVLGIMADVRLVADGGKDLIEIRVDPYPYPVNYKGEYHYRSGSTKQELKGAALDKFLLRKQGRTWDGVPVPDATVRSLSKDAIDAFRARASQSQRMTAADLKESKSGLIEKLHLTDGKYLKRAAVLAFHPEPERFVTGAFVKIGFFRTNDDLLYHDEVHGDLFTQVGRTMDLLLTKYLKAAITYRGIQRVETFPVPEPALREAILNAIIHKDYATCTPVQISVYADKLMVWNPGQLPQDWTVEKLKAKHASLPYNPGVANVFFRAGEIEAWGRGVERILAACREARFPEPVIEQEATGLWIHFQFSPEIVERTAAGPAPEAANDRTREKPREKTREKLLRLVKGDPTVSTEALASALGITPKGVEWQIKRLKADGLLTRVGADKGGHWEVSE